MRPRTDVAAARAAVGAALRDAKDALNRDRTGLAHALVEIIAHARGSRWITEGRGPYEWDDDEYRKETGNMIDAIVAIAERGLKASGDLATLGVRAAEQAEGQAEQAKR